MAIGQSGQEKIVVVIDLSWAGMVEFLSGAPTVRHLYTADRA